MLLELRVPSIFLLVCGLAEGVGPSDLSCGLVDVEEALGPGIELAYPNEGDNCLEKECVKRRGEYMI